MDPFSNLPHILFLVSVAAVIALMMVAGEGDEETAGEDEKKMRKRG